MVREVVTINIGQGGASLGNNIWKQYGAEHKIDVDGKMKKVKGVKKSFTTFYEEVGDRYVPRNLTVDLESSVIDQILKGPMGKLFNPNDFVYGTEDAASVFARGYYTVGREIIKDVMERGRKIVERCNSLQGFQVNHSVGGGTGSGLGGLILETLVSDYKKVGTVGCEIYPSPNISTCVTEPYNTLFASRMLCDYTNVSLVMDNEALYGVCQRNLKLKKPSYVNLNRIIAKVVSSMTCSLRFVGEQNVDMAEFEVNLVPFPRLHFMTSCLAPVISGADKEHELLNTLHVTKEVVSPANFLVKYSTYDVELGKYMAVNLNYRGKVSPKNVGSSCVWIKENDRVQLVDWCPTGFKIGMNNEPIATTKDDDMAHTDLSCTLLGNNVAIESVFRRCLQKTSLMYSRRAYVHWYVGEGLEEGEFSEAKEELEYLCSEYKEVTEPDGASDGESEDYDE